MIKIESHSLKHTVEIRNLTVAEPNSLKHSVEVRIFVIFLCQSFLLWCVMWQLPKSDVGKLTFFVVDVFVSLINRIFSRSEENVYGSDHKWRHAFLEFLRKSITFVTRRSKNRLTLVTSFEDLVRKVNPYLNNFFYFHFLLSL